MSTSYYHHIFKWHEELEEARVMNDDGKVQSRAQKDST